MLPQLSATIKRTFSAEISGQISRTTTGGLNLTAAAASLQGLTVQTSLTSLQGNSSSGATALSSGAAAPPASTFQVTCLGAKIVDYATGVVQSQDLCPALAQNIERNSQGEPSLAVLFGNISLCSTCALIGTGPGGGMVEVTRVDGVAFDASEIIISQADCHSGLNFSGATPLVVPAAPAEAPILLCPAPPPSTYSPSMPIMQSSLAASLAVPPSANNSSSTPSAAPAPAPAPMADTRVGAPLYIRGWVGQPQGSDPEALFLTTGIVFRFTVRVVLPPTAPPNVTEAGVTLNISCIGATPLSSIDSLEPASTIDLCSRFQMASRPSRLRSNDVEVGFTITGVALCPECVVQVAFSIGVLSGSAIGFDANATQFTSFPACVGAPYASSSLPPAPFSEAFAVEAPAPAPAAIGAGPRPVFAAAARPAALQTSSCSEASWQAGGSANSSAASPRGDACPATPAGSAVLVALSLLQPANHSAHPLQDALSPAQHLKLVPAVASGNTTTVRANPARAVFVSGTVMIQGSISLCLANLTVPINFNRRVRNSTTAHWTVAPPSDFSLRLFSVGVAGLKSSAPTAELYARDPATLIELSTAANGLLATFLDLAVCSGSCWLVGNAAAGGAMFGVAHVSGWEMACRLTTLSLFPCLVLRRTPGF